MAKFKCIHTGTILEFKSIYDIQEMRKHQEYTEVKEEEKPKQVKETPVSDSNIAVVETKPEAVAEAVPVKRGRGRPKKVTTVEV